MDLFGNQAISYFNTLKKPQHLPAGVDILYPYGDSEVKGIVATFFETFFMDSRPRTFLIGINPGRLGAGITGIPFTDPVNLQNELNCLNTFDKKHELSSRFIYRMIEALGGPKKFYSHFYITAVSPVGFVKDGRNMNYYDDPLLESALESYIKDEMEKQLVFGANPVAYSLGMGKNIAYLQKFNKKFGFFKEVRPLPHPRWIMQYRLKKLDHFVEQYRTELGSAM